jgi:DNA topoisomerase I
MEDLEHSLVVQTTPECKFTRPLSRAKAAEQDFLAEPKVFGETDNKEKIVLKKGRFGPLLANW